MSKRKSRNQFDLDRWGFGRRCWLEGEDEDGADGAVQKQ